MSMGVSRPVVIIATALSLLGLTACSSYERVQSLGAGAGSASATGTSGSLAGGAGGTGPAGAAGSSTASGQSSALSASGGSGSVGAANGGESASDGASTPGRTASASGSKCTVKVGVTYSSDVNAALAGAGDPSQAANYGNYVAALQAEYQAGADYINRSGGLAGCQMVLGYYDFKSLSADGFAAESQRECVSLAEDQHVALAFIYGLENRTLIDCMASHKIPVFYHGGEYTVPDDQDYRSYRGYLYQETGFATDRWGRFINFLSNAGYFDKGTKVGILLADDGNGNNQNLVNNILKPKLAQLGYPNPTVFTFTALQGYSAVGDTQAQLSSAVLQFKLAGVDHVISTPDSGATTLFFAQHAESQNYHPRYAFTSVNYPELMKNAPADQAARSLSVSFLASDAENPQAMAANYPNAARSQCDTLFKGKTNGGPAPYLYCDFMNVVTSALRGKHTVDPATLQAGIEGLGTSLTGTGDYGGTRFGPGRYDGGTSVRVMAWDPNVKDYVYVTGPLDVP